MICVEIVNRKYLFWEDLTYGEVVDFYEIIIIYNL